MPRPEPQNLLYWIFVFVIFVFSGGVVRRFGVLEVVEGKFEYVVEPELTFWADVVLTDEVQDLVTELPLGSVF